tara:strand:+ start:49 stop:282 length:234 start_codon:yes stop_codon:yes gene_type:complete
MCIVTPDRDNMMPAAEPQTGQGAGERRALCTRTVQGVQRPYSPSKHPESYKYSSSSRVVPAGSIQAGTTAESPIVLD